MRGPTKIRHLYSKFRIFENAYHTATDFLFETADLGHLLRKRAQRGILQNGETPAKVEIKEENAENKSVAETAETSPPTENGKNETGSAPDENGKENQVCKNFHFRRTPHFHRRTP